MNENNKIININIAARLVICRNQDEIIADRRKKRKEKYNELKKQIRNMKVEE